MTAQEKLELAHRHLERVQSAWDDPTDWDDLSLYGFYCIEAAVEAAAIHVGITSTTKHWQKANTATILHEQHGLPDVSDLMRTLNDARKAVAYGDIAQPIVDPEEVANSIESFVSAVEAFLP